MDPLYFKDAGSATAQSAEAPAPLAPVRPPRPRGRMLAIAGVVAGAAVALVLTQVTGARGDQKHEIQRVVKTYETAIMTGHGDTACAQLTPAGVQEMLRVSAGAGQGNSCAAVSRAMNRYIDTLMSQAPSPAKAAEARRMIEDPPVEVVAVNGDSATAKISGVSDKPIRLTHGDGGWKISGFSFPG